MAIYRHSSYRSFTEFQRVELEGFMRERSGRLNITVSVTVTTGGGIIHGNVTVNKKMRSDG